MKLYVLSSRRAGVTGAYCTLRNLQAASSAVANATLFVPRDQLAEYKRYFPAAEIVGHSATGISQTRKVLATYHRRKFPTDPHIVMLDDDLRFYTRRTDDKGKFVDATPASIDTMLAAIDNELRSYALVGISSREGGNNQQQDELNTRIVRLAAYNLDFVERAGAKFGRIELMEDFDMQLQLARAGYASSSLCMWAQGQKGSGEAGGCSTYRTPELQTQCANRLAELHPGFVKVVEKETKTSFGGGTRTDVTVYWKKAYGSSQ